MYFLLTEHGFSASSMTYFLKKKSHFSSIKKAIFLLAIFWVFLDSKDGKIQKTGRCQTRLSHCHLAIFVELFSPCHFRLGFFRGIFCTSEANWHSTVFCSTYSLLKFFCNFLFLLSPKFIQFVEQPLSWLVCSAQ